MADPGQQGALAKGSNEYLSFHSLAADRFEMNKSQFCDRFSNFEEAKDQDKQHSTALKSKESGEREREGTEENE